jgi:hypothetical protein
MWIQKAQKHMDSTDPDPQHWFTVDIINLISSKSRFQVEENKKKSRFERRLAKIAVAD